MTEKLQINSHPVTGAIGEDAILGVSIASTGEAVGHQTALRPGHPISAAAAGSFQSHRYQVQVHSPRLVP